MSALATLNGFDVQSMRLTLPVAGAWWADCVVDGAVSGAGQATLAIGDRGFSGTMVGGTWKDSTMLRIRGGAGGLSKELGPFSYQQVTVQAAVTDILKVANEVRSPQSDAELLSRVMSFYHYARTQCGIALKQLLDLFGANWRILPNGQLWMGFDAWPDNNQPFEVLSTSPHLGRVLLAVEGVGILPGTKLSGKKVSRVEYRLDEGRPLEASVLFSEV